MLRLGSPWSCFRSYFRLLQHGHVQPKVFFDLNFRVYLVILNILTLIFTAALQFGGVTFLFAFRVCQGVMCGVFMNFIPVYIGELTPKEFGSRFGVYPQISVVMGVFVSFAVGMIMTDCFNYEFLPTNVPVN